MHKQLCNRNAALNSGRRAAFSFKTYVGISRHAILPYLQIAWFSALSITSAGTYLHFSIQFFVIKFNVVDTKIVATFWSLCLHIRQ